VRASEAAVGGYLSGNHGGQPTVEASLFLDLYAMLRGGTLLRDDVRSGRIVFSNGYTGERIGWISYFANLDELRGRMRLTHGSGHLARDYWVDLTTTEQPLGGRRWWFICPVTGRRVRKLYLPPGAITFASRQAYRLGYCSQRETAAGRSLSQSFKLRAKLGCEDEWRKPKWMRWATFHRYSERLERLERICDVNFFSVVARLTRRSGRF
jgi:hypothetical protein